MAPIKLKLEEILNKNEEKIIIPVQENAENESTAYTT